MAQEHLSPFRLVSNNKTLCSGPVIQSLWLELVSKAIAVRFTKVQTKQSFYMTCTVPINNCGKDTLPKILNEHLPVLVQHQLPSGNPGCLLVWPISLCNLLAHFN